MLPRLFTLLAFCSLVALDLSGADGAAPDKLNSLLNNSPFGSSRNGAQVGGSANDPLEFRSVIDEGGSKIYSIYDNTTHHSTWVGLNDSVNGFSVKSYDPSHDSVSVEYQGKTLTLSMKKAPAVAQIVPPPTLGPGPVPPNSNVMIGPAPSSPMDQQRLQQIQEEIRRRRALRNQASGANGGLQPGAMPSAQPYSTSGPALMPPTSSTGPQPAQPKP